MSIKKIFSSACLLLLVGASPLTAAEKQDMTLQKAVEQALANNLNLKLQQQEVIVASGGVQSASGKFDTTVKAEAGYKSQESTPLYQGAASEEDSGIWGVEATKLFTTGTAITLGWNNTSYDTDAAGMLVDPSYANGLTLGISQSLLKGFGEDAQTAGTKVAEKQLAAASFQVDSQAADLAANVKKAYWSLVFAYQNIEVQQLSLTLARKLLEETEAKIKFGKLAPVELYQPQSEVARREEQLISAERAIGTAEDDLKLLLNNEQWQLTFIPTDEPPTAPVNLDEERILEHALQNRPDIKAASLLAEAARLEADRAADATRPDLSLVGKIGITGTDDTYGDSWDDSVSDPENLWQIGVTLTMPLENSAAKGYHQQAKAQYTKARLNTELLRQQVRRTVRTTIRDVALAIKALDATRKTSLATRKRLEAEQAKFASGLSTTLDVLTAQDAYSQALSQEKQTAIVYANALAEIDRIQGLVTMTTDPLP